MTENIRSNRGTWQYWEIFKSCVSEIRTPNDFSAILKKGEPVLEKRLQNKLGVLRALQNNGIWLLDASIVGINGDTLSAKTKREVIEASWAQHVKSLVQGLSPRPELLVVIGKAVEETLRDELVATHIPREIILQPARIPYDRFFKDLLKLSSLAKKYRC